MKFSVYKLISLIAIIISITILFLIFIIKDGCDKRQDYTRKKPDMNMITGKWIVAKKSIYYINRYSSNSIRNSSISLYNDHRFVCSNFPVVAPDYNESIYFVDGKGKWRMEIFAKSWRITISLPNGYAYSLNIHGNQLYYLSHPIGNQPNSAERIFFVREREKS